VGEEKKTSLCFRQLRSGCKGKIRKKGKKRRGGVRINCVLDKKTCFGGVGGHTLGKDG